MHIKVMRKYDAFGFETKKEYVIDIKGISLKKESTNGNTIFTYWAYLQGFLSVVKIEIEEEEYNRIIGLLHKRNMEETLKTYEEGECWKAEEVPLLLGLQV